MLFGKEVFSIGISVLAHPKFPRSPNVRHLPSELYLLLKLCANRYHGRTVCSRFAEGSYTKLVGRNGSVLCDQFVRRRGESESSQDQDSEGLQSMKPAVVIAPVISADTHIV